MALTPTAAALLAAHGLHEQRQARLEAVLARRSRPGFAATALQACHTVEALDGALEKASRRGEVLRQAAGSADRDLLEPLRRRLSGTYPSARAARATAARAIGFAIADPPVVSCADHELDPQVPESVRAHLALDVTAPGAPLPDGYCATTHAPGTMRPGGLEVRTTLAGTQALGGRLVTATALLHPVRGTVQIEMHEADDISGADVWCAAWRIEVTRRLREVARDHGERVVSSWLGIHLADVVAGIDEVWVLSERLANLSVQLLVSDLLDHGQRTHAATVAALAEDWGGSAGQLLDTADVLLRAPV